jgi:pimeloyl-ACP methyl ester carboxylesterase
MRYADAGSVRIAYDDEGPRADDAVVFLGGWYNSGRSFFAPIAERLAARHRVIRLDWRGHGIPASRPRTSATVWCRYLRRTAAGRRCGFAACWVTGCPDHLAELDGP